MLAWALFLSAIVVMAFFPDTAAARWLRRTLIEGPTAFLDRQKPARVLAWTLIIGVALTLLIIQPQLAMILGGAGDLSPLIAGLVDGSVALEMMIAVWLAVSSGVVKGVWRLVVRASTATTAVVRRVQAARRGRARRTRSDRPSQKPKTPSDEPGFLGDFAFA